MNVRTLVNYSWLVISVFWLATSLLSKPAVRVQSASSRLLHSCIIVLGFILIFNTSWPLGPLNETIIPPAEAIAYFGCALTLAGILFAIWARLSLGGNWSASVTVKQDHTLIRKRAVCACSPPDLHGICVCRARNINHLWPAALLCRRSFGDYRLSHEIAARRALHAGAVRGSVSFIQTQCEGAGAVYLVKSILKSLSRV